MFAAAKPFDETVRDHVKLPEGEFFVKSWQGINAERFVFAGG
jgi:hypothetical protein